MVYQSQQGVRDVGSRMSFVGGATLRNSVLSQISVTGINKVEYHSGSKMIYSLETG